MVRGSCLCGAVRFEYGRAVTEVAPQFDEGIPRPAAPAPPRG